MSTAKLRHSSSTLWTQEQAINFRGRDRDGERVGGQRAREEQQQNHSGSLMERGSSFSYGGGHPRMDRPLDQFMATQVHSTLAQPRTPETLATGVPHPLDLASAVAHELRRSITQPGWLSWHPQVDGRQTSSFEANNDLQMPYGSLLEQERAGAFSRQDAIPQYIPRFDQDLQGPARLQQLPTRFESYTPTHESDSFVSAQQEFYSRSDNGLSPLHPSQQVLDTPRFPWIERMMQSDVRPTPCPSGQSLGNSTSSSIAQRGASVGEVVSCVASQTVDLQSCHSSDMQQRSEKSMRSSFSCDPQLDSTLELSVDMCTDDDDLETHPLDVKRKRRMLSNRASAQRSRHRRQERLDQLEVLTAQLRVENSTLQKKFSAAIQLARKFEDQNKSLVRKVDRMSKELEGSKKARKLISAFDACAGSQQTTCASSCEMICGRLSVNPNTMRDGNTNDGASTPSTSPRSPGCPSESSPTENEGEMDVTSNGNAAEVSPVRESLSACRMGSKQRSHDESRDPAAFGVSYSISVGNQMGSGCLVSQPSRPRLTSSLTGIGGGTTGLLEPSRPFLHELCNPLGLDPTLKDDSNLDFLEADRWFEFTDCFM